MRYGKGIVKVLLEAAGYQVNKLANVRTRKSWPVPSVHAQTFFDLDERFHGLYDQAQVATQMQGSDNAFRRQRHYTLNYLLLSAHLEQGDICEVGCWRGLSAYQIASHVKKVNPTISFHIFDSFEGLSESAAIDRTTNSARRHEQSKEAFVCDLGTVQENLKQFDFIRYHQGWIPSRFDEVKDRTFSFVHVDVDLYQPTYDTIQFFFPRLARHGMMVFDDYGSTAFPGAKKAVDDYLTSIERPFFIPLPSGQAFLIKAL